MGKARKYPAVKFPTGVVAYLDEHDVLQGTPAAGIATLGKRESPEELNSFEVFLKNYIVSGGR